MEERIEVGSIVTIDDINRMKIKDYELLWRNYKKYGSPVSWNTIKKRYKAKIKFKVMNLGYGS